jgi:hypothetical protein
MSRDLNETLRRFAAAQKASIRYKGLQWDEFEGFLAALKQLERICDQLFPPSEVSQWLSVLRYARRIMRSAPVNPGHESLQLERFCDVDPSLFPEQIANEFRKCQQSVSVLLDADTHPSWKHIDAIFERPQASANALVTKAAVVSVNEISIARGWNLIATDLTRAKKVPITDLALLFGSPEFHISWHFDLEESSRMVAWLFNSPIAHETHILSWPGNLKFDIGRYRAWDGAPTTDVAISGSTSFSIDVDRLQEISTSRTAPPVITDTNSGHVEPVTATAIRLTDESWIFLSDDAGPSANYLEMDDFDVVVKEAKSIKHLTPGKVLIVRDGDAGRSFLEEEASNWIRERHDETQEQRSIEARQSFRNAVQVLSRDPLAITRLRNVGIDEDQARRRLRLSHDPDHIAPKEESVFEAICQAANHQVSDTDWSDIVVLRTAYRQAGHRARKQLEEAIQGDESWQEVVERPAQAKIARKGLGAIVLAPVIEILDETVNVPISQLGTLKKGK